ncbi:MAG: YfhO family protein [Ruminococcus sp.]|nr:YfhO family protein [Ruminococcus sp.]
MKTEHKTRRLRYASNTKEKYLQAFIMGFAVIMVTFIPIMICEHGYFIYYGDFNAQQIPFHTLLNNAVRNGQFGWNWFTDLGSDLLTSYSFYLIGSPFFWLTTIIPKWLVSSFIPVLLAIKHGIASLTSYIYIRRFVRGKESALTGALMYTFSGFQVFNLFFNHFQDVTALFPLMLIAMEENICRNRRGWFAVTVAVMASVNYYFFTGQVVFLIIYFLIRLPSKDFPANWKKFFLLLLEAVLGTAIAGFILLPSALALLDNYRVNQHLYGDRMIFYSEQSRVLRAIQTFFLPSDAPARPNLFKSEGAKWASVGGYMPLFSMLGVITFMRARKKHWAVRISLICILCAFIPVLNSMFYMFNASYYARWYYMPILIFALMTAQSLDDDDADFRPAVKITAGVIVFFGVISFIPIKENDEIKWFSYPNDFAYFWLTTGIAVVFLICAVIIIHRRKKYPKLMTYASAVASVICVIAVVLYGAVTPESAGKYIDSAIKCGEDVYEKVSEENFFRIDISEDRDNYPMLWGLPCMRAFQSVVNTSIMEFYDSVGVNRDVASRADVSHYTLRGLFSVKYFYREKVDGYTYEELKSMTESPDSSELTDKNGIRASRADIEKELPGFRYIAENEYFEIYENEHYIPMGFGYDTYISENDSGISNKSVRERSLISALVLSDEQIEKYSGILKKAGTDVLDMDKKSYITACEEKRAKSSHSFTYDSKGFEAGITLDKPQLVFFSVPYSDGWTAEVNGQPADVEKVSYGFMAVKADSGENKIVFRYTTPGLREGIIISLSGLILLLIYVLICRKYPEKQKFISHRYDYNSCQKITASEIYSNRTKSKKIHR